MADIVSLRGDSLVEANGEPSAMAIELAEALMERVRSGRTQGFAVVELHADGQATWNIAGIVGGFGMLGALEMVRDDLIIVNKAIEDAV